MSTGLGFSMRYSLGNPTTVGGGSKLGVRYFLSHNGRILHTHVSKSAHPMNTIVQNHSPPKRALPGLLHPCTETDLDSQLLVAKFRVHRTRISHDGEIV